MRNGLALPQVVSLLPGLKKLDNMDVTTQERSSRGLQLDRSPAGPSGAAASGQVPAAPPPSPAARAGGPQQGTAGQTAAGSTPAATEAWAAMKVRGAGAVPPEVANGVQPRDAPGAPDAAAHVMQQAAVLVAMAPAQQPVEAQQLVWEGPAAAALRPPLSRTPSVSACAYLGWLGRVHLCRVSLKRLLLGLHGQFQLLQP